MSDDLLPNGTDPEPWVNDGAKATGQFTAVPPTTAPGLPLGAVDPILRNLSRSGRADVLEAIADLLDPPSGPAGGVHLHAVAHVLRVLAPRERRS